jgi:hypothetical protein
MTKYDKPLQSNTSEYDEASKPLRGEPRKSQSSDSDLSRREEQDDEKSEREIERTT